ADPKSDRPEAQYGEALRLALRHDREVRRGPYFPGPAVGAGRAVDAAADGLRIEVGHPLFAPDWWHRTADAISMPHRGAGAQRSGTRPLWPDLSLLSVQADQMRILSTRLDQAVLRVSRSPEDQWSMNLRSEQTSGTLKWQERDGRVLGRMSARFARLRRGGEPHDARSLLAEGAPDAAASFDDDLEIPGIVLQA